MIFYVSRCAMQLPTHGATNAVALGLPTYIKPRIYKLANVCIHHQGVQTVTLPTYLGVGSNKGIMTIT